MSLSIIHVMKVLICFFFLQQGKGISGNFEKSKLNPIPSKKDNSEVSFKHSFDKF